MPASPIKDFEISKTFKNVILTTVTGSSDTDGIPTGNVPSALTGAQSYRDQGRLQDGLGSPIPLILSKNLIEVEVSPTSANSVIRRQDAMAIASRQYINTIIWN